MISQLAMAHNTCPDCGSRNVVVTLYSYPDGLAVGVLCRACPTVWSVSEKQNFVGVRFSRLRDGPAKRGNQITDPETGVSLSCPHCRGSLRLAGFLAEPNLPASAAVFVCSEHGNFSLRYGSGGLVDEPNA